MQSRLTRRAFLTTAGALPFTSFATSSMRAQGAGADVVVIGGDPAAFAAVYRLTRTAGLRVVLVDDAPAWRPPSVPTPTAIAALPPFARGHQVCFDSWRDLGNPGWGYEDVLPSFKRLEKYEGGASEYRGADGPLSVVHCWDPHALHRAFLLASVSGGFQQDSRHDFNGPRSQSFAGYYQKAALDDGPHSFDAAFLAPAKGAGLTVVSGAVTRVVMEKGRAVGVEVARGATREVVRAARGVLVCAEPMRAAQILLLSGIGPADHLKAMGVPVVADRPGVGVNLHDQQAVALRWRALEPALGLPESTVTAGMFTVSLNASPPDLQMDYLDPRAAGGPLLGIDVILVQPTSRGEVRLASADPQAAPVVRLNALATEADVTALVQGVRLARFIAGSPQLDRLRGDETADTAAAVPLAALQALVKANARARAHTAGTCAMGRASDAAAVVDATLAVHGVQGLRVAGAAVMPVVVNAPPAAASLMIGDRAADFLLAGPTARP